MTQRQNKQQPAEKNSQGTPWPAEEPEHQDSGPRLQIFLPLGLLAGVLTICELTPLDLWIQDFFYDFHSRQWLVPFDKNSHLGLALYVIPKILLGAFGGVLLLLTLKPKWGRLASPWSRPRLVYVLLCMALIPSLVSLLKAHTGVAYPRKIVRYGGAIPYRNVWHSIPRQAGEKRYKGWPAGHASGGFALIGLAFAALSRRGRQIGAALAITAGWLMGTYQMLAGNHYLSHTIISMLLAWLVADFLAWCFRLGRLSGQA